MAHLLTKERSPGEGTVSVFCVGCVCLRLGLIALEFELRTSLKQRLYSTAELQPRPGSLPLRLVSVICWLVFL